MAPDRILVVEASVREIEQRPELAVAHAPAVGDEDLSLRFEVARLVAPHAPDRSGNFQTTEVERPTGTDVDEAGQAGLDQVGG